MLQETEFDFSTMIALLKEQEERELLFFESEVAALTEHLFQAHDEVLARELAEDMKTRKDEHAERIRALRQAQAAYTFGFKLDNALLLTARGLSVILKAEYDGTLEIPKQDVERIESPTAIILEDSIVFHV